MRRIPSLERTKSSVFSLTSTTTAMMVNRNMAKKKVVKNFFSMYQSIFFIRLTTKIKAGSQQPLKRMLIDKAMDAYNRCLTTSIIAVFQL